MLLFVGAAGIFITIYLMIKQFETRMVLFMSGLVMCLIALDPLAAFKGFTSAIKGASLIEIITSSMGFAFVMEYTKCDKHLVHLLASGLKKAGPALIPGAVIVTALVHIAVPSAGGCVASVGPVLIPILINSGVHPAMAASTVFAGTFGWSHLSPGFHQIVVVSEATKISPVDIVANLFSYTVIVGLVVALSVTAVAFFLKEHKGYQKEEVAVEDFKVNLLYALIPLVPLALIVLGASGAVPVLKKLAISHAMLIGVMIACAATRTKPGDISNAFFKGMGQAYGHIYGIIICSAVFVAGLTATGLLKEMLEAMSSHPDIAKIAGTFGPFALAVICGSGDAASVAFNNAVTPHAASFGITPIDLGTVAAVGGALGRSMSPIAGAAIICCGLAGITNPMDLAKRNAVPMLVGLIVLSFFFFYFK